MKITGYGFRPVKNCTADSRVPVVPEGVVLDDGHLVDRDGQSLPVDGVSLRQLRAAIEIPIAHWIGIEPNGDVVILGVNEKEWRADQAKKAVEQADRMTKSIPSPNAVSAFSETLEAVALIHAGAALVGLSIQEMIRGLAQSRQHPDEPLEEVFQRVKKPG